jgi:ribosome maturation factor RimP
VGNGPTFFLEKEVAAVTDLQAVRAAAEAVFSSRGLALVDVEVVGSGRARTLRLTVESADPEIANNVDLEVLASVSNPVAVALEAADALSGPYTLEVSSPGLERPLRRPADFRRFIGSVVSLKSHEAVFGARRHRGLLLTADDDGITVDVDGEHRAFPYDGIASARTVFEWGPAPKPGGKKKSAAGARSHLEERLT